MPTPLTQPQFDVLHALARADESLTQCRLHEATGMSLGSVNAAVRELEARGCVVGRRRITDAGLEATEPYRVNNAVIMVASLSERFAPISYEHPKGTLRVRGETLIECQIRQLHEAGITDVAVVVGCKKEYFFHLAEQFGVTIVVDDAYPTRNNNGSPWRVRKRLGGTCICSSDDYFTSNPFEPYVYRACYSAQYVEGPTPEWCISTGPGGRITGATIGGRDAWIMLGHAYFDRAFSAAFTRILEEVYDLPRTAPLLWESIYLDHVKELDMVIRRYPAGVINEFDSVDEIRGFDPMFMEKVDSKVIGIISSALGCAKSQIHDFYPLKQGITNLSCHFAVDDREYVYRHPGIGTDKIIDRRAETASLELAGRLGPDRTLLTSDPVEGWKISRFIPRMPSHNDFFHLNFLVGFLVGEWLFIYYRHAADHVDRLLAEYESAARATGKGTRA